MGLQEIAGEVLERRRQQKLEQIRKRVAELDKPWLEQQGKRFGQGIVYYAGKVDEYARHMVLAAELDRSKVMFDGYREILEQAEASEGYDVWAGLEKLQQEVAVQDKEIEKWKKKWFRYEGSEAFWEKK